MNTKQPLWTKDFILICLVNLMTFTSFYFLLPTLPVFVVDALHGNESNVGFIIGVLTITAVIVRPISGYMLDTMGRKKILLIALVAFAVTVLAYNLVYSLLALFALRALHGFSWGFTSTGAGTIASDIIPRSRRGEGMGFYGLTNTLAMAVGPILSLFLLSRYGFNTLFTSGFLVAAIGLVSALGLTSPEIKLNKEKRKLDLGDFIEPRVLSLSATMFFVAVTYGGIVSFITLYANELAVGNAGIYFLAYAISLLFVRPYAGKIFDKRGPVQVMAVGFGSLALAFVLLFMASGVVLFIISAVVMGIGFGIIQPTNMAMAINRVEPFRRGAANGTMMSAFDLGIGVGSIMLGLLSSKIGMSYMYLICGFIVIIPASIFYLKDAKRSGAQPE